MKAGSGTPAARAGALCQAARRRTGQRARDAARTANTWLERQGAAGTLGAGWTALGLFLLLAECAVPGAPSWAFAEGTGICAAGLALLAVARRSRWRR